MIIKFFLFIAISFIRLYQLLLAPFFPDCCRFHPTCSEYAIEAFRVHGLFQGFRLTLWRLIRCNPWNNRLKDDPIPHKCK